MARQVPDRRHGLKGAYAVMALSVNGADGTGGIAPARVGGAIVDVAPSHLSARPTSAKTLPPEIRTATRRALAPYLTQFVDARAALVASWVSSDSELLWLAPGTLPPLTPEKVLAWSAERRQRLMLCDGRDDLSIAYAELNEMPGNRQQRWIGHFLLSPAHRGRGWGVRFAQALLAHAFVELGAADVLLVVFPDNLRAIQCYERAGFIDLGQERKLFKTTGREHLFTRMGISRSRFFRLADAGRLPAEPLRFDFT